MPNQLKLNSFNCSFQKYLLFTGQSIYLFILNENKNYNRSQPLRKLMHSFMEFFHASTLEKVDAQFLPCLPIWFGSLHVCLYLVSIGVLIDKLITKGQSKGLVLRSILNVKTRTTMKSRWRRRLIKWKRMSLVYSG